jgi:hypothetical protein
MVYVDTQPLTYQPASSILLKAVLNALTILVAFNLRDTVTQCVELLTPGRIPTKIVFSFFVTLLFLLITVITAYSFQNMISI